MNIHKSEAQKSVYKLVNKYSVATHIILQNNLYIIKKLKIKLTFSIIGYIHIGKFVIDRTIFFTCIN